MRRTLTILIAAFALASWLAACSEGEFAAAQVAARRDAFWRECRPAFSRPQCVVLLGMFDRAEAERRDRRSADAAESAATGVTFGVMAASRR